MVYNGYYQPMYYSPFTGYFDDSYQDRNFLYEPSRLRGIAYRINEYFIKALVYIQNILDLLLSTSPFFEQYGPILEEVPKMYHLMKAIKEASNETDPMNIQSLDVEYHGAAPKLFI